jgi:hypothetical protein
MLEANTILSAFRRGDERDEASKKRDERDEASKKLIASGLAGLLKGGQEAIERGNRRALFEGDKWENPEAVNDPDYNAAVETFVNTGDLSALNAYKMRKMQERDMAMREEDIKSRKKLAELQDKQGKEDAEKINKEAIDEAMFELETAAVTKNSKTANEDEKKIADIKMKRALNTLKKLGIEIEEMPKKEKPKASDIPEGGEDVPAEEPKIGDEESIQAQVNLFRRRMDEGFKTDAELQKFHDELVATSKANPEAKRNEEFNKLLKEAKNPYLSKEYRDRKESERKAALVNNYNSMDAMSRYTWSIENPKEFNEAKKLAEGK